MYTWLYIYNDTVYILQYYKVKTARLNNVSIFYIGVLSLYEIINIRIMTDVNKQMTQSVDMSVSYNERYW